MRIPPGQGRQIQRSRLTAGPGAARRPAGRQINYCWRSAMTVTITTLVENTAGIPHVIGEWGQSLLIEADGKKVLFDTGPSGAIIENARKLNVDLSNIDVIVLSHGHYDHTGGLKDVLTLIKNAGSRPG